MLPKNWRKKGSIMNGDCCTLTTCVDWMATIGGRYGLRDLLVSLVLTLQNLDLRSIQSRATGQGELRENTMPFVK